MKLLINGKPQHVDSDRLSVAELLDRLKIEQRRGVAVAVDNAVVPRSQWEDHDVEEGDAVEIIRATQGG